MRQLGRYHFSRELSGSTTGKNYLAKLDAGTELEALCVVKVMHRRYAEDVRFTTILTAESSQASCFRHPSAAALLEVSVEQRELMIAHEYIDGRSLASLVARLAETRQRLHWPAVVWIGLQLARLLRVAHATPWATGESKGMVHGALVPTAVHITSGGTVKLPGVGLGRSRACLPTSPVKLAYRAPELFARHKVDPLADVYGLGLVLRDILLARSSFARGVPAETVHAVLNGPVPDVGAERPDVPASILVLLESMTARVPGDRPRSLREIEELLATTLPEPEEVVAARLSECYRACFPAADPTPREAFPEASPLLSPAAPRAASDAPWRAVTGAGAPGGADGAGSVRERSWVGPGPVSSPQARPISGAVPILEVVDAPQALEPGALVGDRYRVLDMIGQGGVSVVYRAEHILLGKEVALKVLRPELSGMRLAVDRFRREARSLCQLDHPRIVRVTDFGRAENGALFLVMELFRGESLYSLLQRHGPLPPELALSLADQVLSGLAHAHERGVVHRDLKPENIMVVRTVHGIEARILDFGIAKLAGEDGVDPLTRAGAVFGTPRYMSPEQAAGDPVDHRTDLYTVGVLLYELLTGRVPFDGDTTMQILSRVLTLPPPPLGVTFALPELGEALERVVARALAKDREERFSSAEQLRRELYACWQVSQQQGASMA